MSAIMNGGKACESKPSILLSMSSKEAVLKQLKIGRVVEDIKHYQQHIQRMFSAV